MIKATIGRRKNIFPDEQKTKYLQKMTFKIVMPRKQSTLKNMLGFLKHKNEMEKDDATIKSF